MTSKLILLSVASIVAGLALAACGSASSPPSSSHSAAPVATSSPSEPAEADTAAGAQAAAQTVFQLYGGQQFAAVWQDMVLSFQQTVPESTYVQVHTQCNNGGHSYQISDPTLASASSAVVTVSLTGVASSLGSEPMDFDYVGGKWLWAPDASMIQPYQAGSASAIVSAMQAQGLCS